MDRGVQPAFAYNPHLNFGKNFWGKKYFGCINRIYKVGVQQGLKNPRKIAKLPFFAEDTKFLSAAIFVFFYSCSFHPAAPGLIGGTLFYQLNQSLVIMHIA